MAFAAGPAMGLAGYISELPTPFDESGEIDWAAFAKICERQIEAGAGAIVVAETAGEASNLTTTEHAAVVRAAVRIAQGRMSCPVCARLFIRAAGRAGCSPREFYSIDLCD